jgi:steroid 5-alpha reductase family enzyme
VLGLVALWAARRSISLIVRGMGKAEDSFYQALHERHEPHFRWKSLYLVFWMQAVVMHAAICRLRPENERFLTASYKDSA